MNRKALLIPIVPCNLIVQGLSFTINISLKLILRRMTKVTVFGADILDVLNIICGQHFLRIFYSLNTLRRFTLFISYWLIRRILFIRQFLCSTLQISALQFFLLCLIQIPVFCNKLTDTLFNNIPLKDRSSIRLHDASF